MAVHPHLEEKVGEGKNKGERLAAEVAAVLAFLTTAGLVWRNTSLCVAGLQNL